MLVTKRTKAEILLAIGIIGFFVARALAKRTGALPFLIGIAGWIIFIYGCMAYVEAKGYSKWLGLLGLLACVGFTILVLLPDRHADDTYAGT